MEGCLSRLPCAREWRRKKEEELNKQMQINHTKLEMGRIPRAFSVIQ